MRKVLLAYARKMLKIIGVCTLMSMISLLAIGRFNLMGGLLVGYLTGFAWYAVSFGRLWRSSDMTAPQARNQMFIGLFLRLLLFGTVLWAAIQTSVEQFGAVLCGFALVNVLGMVMLMHISYTDAYDKYQ